MKRLFAKASKPKFSLPKSLAGLGAGLNLPVGTSSPAHSVPHLQPKYVVPPVPHPCPYDHLAVLATKDGLLIRPHIPNRNHKTEESKSYVRVSWGKPVRVEEVSDAANGEEIAWDESVIVYGIVGVLELLSGCHLLVITSKLEVGNVIDASHAVYGVKGVTAIPLVEEKARITLNTLASRNAQFARPSLLSSTTMDTISSPRDPLAEDSESPEQDETDLPRRSSPRVQFSPDTQIKFMTPVTSTFPQDSVLSSSPLSSCSDLSTQSESSFTNSSVANTLASRLSFWTRLSKRTSHSSDQLGDPVAELRPLSLTEESESLDKIMEEGKEEPAEVLDSILNATAPPPTSAEEQHSELEEKIVRECVRELTKGGMYFAYTFDITRSLQHKQEQVAKYQKQHSLLAELNALPSPEAVEGTKISPMTEPHPMLPLWRRVDRRFWWNEWLSKPFIDAGLHSYVLPIMQGYFQIAQFNVPPDPITHDEDVLADYVIVSRRSRYRAGLRYQRRGIDDDANVANFVETETIMRVERLGVENIFAYVQLRGSIPLFWTQSGNGLKPPPLLASDRTHAQNLHALKRHFHRTVPLYGPHTVLNLAEQQGKEGAITQGFREYMQELDSKDARYFEYDFHKETKGMKYENISKLIDIMDRNFDAQGYLWISDNTIMSQQKGVFRVNCIDCLDRTNVVQSAFARYVLNKQLGAVALLNPQGEGRTEIDLVFNDVWANNGDAISRAYAGTSALKGDFTRTGKRDLSGLLNDGVNSLARMYTSTFSDWFCQAVIDFMLGYRTVTVFSEFLLKLQSTDPRDLIRLSKIRAEAIATSVSRVLAEGERLLSGWTLFAPEELNVRIGDKFEEKVLLLTAKALYIISYDYTLEKVKLYTRVPLGDITGISKGAYILSPLEEASRDPAQNAGFVVTWHNSNQVTRVTSYSVRNSLQLPPTPTSPMFPHTVSSQANPFPLPFPLPRPASTVSLTSSLAATRQSAINAGAKLTRSLTRKSVGIGSGGGGVKGLSSILTNAALATGAESACAAFKVLPIDPARIRRGSSVGDAMGDGVEYIEAADELSGAKNCREAVEMIVDSIRRACEDVGGAQGEFVADEDVVSLAEAQRMTSVYAKMEYGVKRLLWLGG
ncbi:Phosphatidylinositide phosphatase SAC2 [Hypsizygus marmoreus]|uniref:Phosphatidylinositide phosphatase SAC2 n=1 Tax=Hypsizygus marmoreus TaxID=39966 RepID=A0A369JL26_HYPMA|nr:Phosphatidylinositide phosphatase SAC2 [Hypsizygus marmoreus]